MGWEDGRGEGWVIFASYPSLCVPLQSFSSPKYYLGTPRAKKFGDVYIMKRAWASGAMKSEVYPVQFKTLVFGRRRNLQVFIRYVV